MFANGADAEIFWSNSEAGGIFEVAFEIVDEGADGVCVVEDVSGDEFEFGCELERVDDFFDGGELCVEVGKEGWCVFDGFVSLKI